MSLLVWIRRGTGGLGPRLAVDMGVASGGVGGKARRGSRQRGRLAFVGFASGGRLAVVARADRGRAPTDWWVAGGVGSGGVPVGRAGVGMRQRGMGWRGGGLRMWWCGCEILVSMMIGLKRRVCHGGRTGAHQGGGRGR